MTHKGRRLSSAPHNGGHISSSNRCVARITGVDQGHLVFGHGIAPQEENEYRVWSHVEPCFPGTLSMRQNPVLRWTTMIAQPQPLIEVFAEMPDFHRCRGKRHPLPAILSLACCEMLCRYPQL